MSSSRVAYYFDAVDYPGYQNAKSRAKKWKHSKRFWLNLIAFTIPCVVGFAYFVDYGDLTEEPILVSFFVALLAFGGWLVYRDLKQQEPPTDMPVRISAGRYLIVGSRSWSVGRIGRITEHRRTRQVEIREKDGHPMVVLYRDQFGDFDEFLRILKELLPELKDNRD